MAVRLLLDEDVWVGLATVLREAGYDVATVSELDRKGLSDMEQLLFAIQEKRVILTHNIRDFVPLAVQLFEQEIEHPGILVAQQFHKGVLAKRTLALLNQLSSRQLANTLRFV